MVRAWIIIMHLLSGKQILKLKPRACYSPLEIMHKKKATEAAYDENSGQAKDVSSMEENDPWNPPYPPCAPGPCKDLTAHIKLIDEVQ